MTRRHLSRHNLSKLPHHTSGRTFGPDGFSMHQARIHGGSSRESGLAPETLRPLNRDSTTRPPQLTVVNLRSDNRFNDIRRNGDGEMASEVDADKNFESIPKHRVRQLDYENQDEPIIDAQEIYKIEFFYHLFDTAINSLEQRFFLAAQQLLLFLYHIYELKDVSSSVILADYKDLETILRDGESSDINSLELCNEMFKKRKFSNY
ncbi:hypothetical protein AVEN_140834-1 [Araneus ventricosus]|uniref:Uncharacterized protein n=1 Tax=Araneus ventricosus TaxID=182803 RepID=A0A4Y2FR27_ARAVE|nr:hypothetical protein AVEN_140834-1 [Araneus ventricosus]